MSGITVTPRSRRTASASGVVGPFAPSATIVALAPDDAAPAPQQPGRHAADVAEPLDDDLEPLQVLPEPVRGVVDGVDDAPARRLAAAGGAAHDERLARGDAAHALALGHRVGVHHPGH